MLRLSKRFSGSFSTNFFRRHFQYKPKDRPSDSVESFATKDILLYRYENPTKILKRTALATSIFGMFSFSAWTFYDVGSKVRGNRQKDEDSRLSRLADNVQGSLKPICIAFFLMSGGFWVYWLLRNYYTVRRIILRKGGSFVTIVTYGLTGVSSRNITIPLKAVCAY